MFIYQCQLAWRSIRKNPILCGLMVLSLGCGIAAYMICYTNYYMANINPLVHKDEHLFMLQTDSWDEKKAYEGLPLNQMPDVLSYRDVTALMNSSIPLRKTPSIAWGGTVAIPDGDEKPFIAWAKINSRDYFVMFEETFLYGGEWPESADQQSQNVVILSEETNQQLFQGKNSVGQSILFERNIYQIVGVLKHKQGKTNKMQEIDRNVFFPDTQVYFPFGIVADHEIAPWRQLECPVDTHDYGNGYQAQLKGSCLWITYWVEFLNTQQKTDYENFITHYIESQKAIGYYPRPLRFALSNASEKIHINRISSPSVVLLLIVGALFLTCCTANCISMLLAKFLRNAGESGVRRALGASQKTIFMQHIMESLFIGLLGGALGLALTFIGQFLLRRGFAAVPSTKGMTSSSMDSYFSLDAQLLITTLIVAIGASLCAGIYPAWRVCRTPTAQALKSQ